MLNKLQFNNLVISNKKGIQQAQIQTINKLVHKIRKLKTLLEKHPDNSKCKERVRKSTETMEFLKKIKRVDIMKQVLLMDKPPAAIITNGLATPDEVGVALLAMNKIMQVLIKRFKTDMMLNDKDANNWKEELRESSKRRQKIERTEEKRRKRLETKEQKAVGRKRQEWIEKNNPAADVTQKKNYPDTYVSTVGKWSVEELDMGEKVATIKNIDKKKVSATKKMERNKKQKEKVLKKIENDIELSEEDTGGMVQNKIEESIGNHDFSDDHVQKEKVKDCDKESEETMVVDSFFITDTGENYLSTAVIKRGQNGETENNDQRGIHMIKLNSTKNTNDIRDLRQKSRDSNQQNFGDRMQNMRNNEGNGQRKYQPNNWSNRNEGNEKLQQNKDKDYKTTSRDKNFKNQRNNLLNKGGQNLHPSWAAKQKLKPVITSFQGKKITFDVDDNRNKTSNTCSQPQNNSKANQTPKTTNSDNDSLHPSWIAKQKLKPTITAFQGKKITFDN